MPTKTLTQMLGELVFEVGQVVVSKVQEFKRQRTPAQQMDQLEQWRRNHIPLTLTKNGECSVCKKPRARDTELCSGPGKVWHAPNAATASCPHPLHPEGNNYAKGCVICDPLARGPSL